MHARWCCVAWLVVGRLLLGPGTAHAHDVRGSAVYLDMGQDAVGIELHLPLRQLRAALGSELTSAQLSRSQELRDYLAQHLRARTREGVALHLQLWSAKVVAARDDDELLTKGVLVGELVHDMRWIELQCDLIVHRVVSHNIYVFVRRDLLTGLVGPEPELAGMLHWQRTTLVVDRRDGGVLRGLYASFALGASHIAHGADHLLFLLMLLLPAPLRARSGRWGELGPSAQSAWHVLTRVTAFTLGHACTLSAGALRGLSLPMQIVELLIAASVVLSAVHALRPVIGGGEAYVAAGFGLVHGLGFATALREFGFDASSLTLALLGFNLGIEAVQLGLVLLAAPWLLWAAQRHQQAYRWIRLTGALLGLGFGTIWIAQRAAYGFGQGEFGVMQAAPAATQYEPVAHWQGCCSGAHCASPPSAAVSPGHADSGVRHAAPRGKQYEPVAQTHACSAGVHSGSVEPGAVDKHPAVDKSRHANNERILRSKISRVMTVLPASTVACASLNLWRQRQGPQFTTVGILGCSALRTLGHLEPLPGRPLKVRRRVAQHCA